MKNEMSDLAPLFLDLGKSLKAAFENQVENFGARNRLSYDNLYGYENLVYGAFRLSESLEKEEALRILIDEYNHPDADFVGSSRPHDHINLILCELVSDERILTEQERERVMSQLNLDRFEKDRKYYEALKKIEGFRVL